MKHLYLVCLLGFLVSCSPGRGEEQPAASYYEEEGYIPLYENDLSQWRGQISEDPRKVPAILDTLSEGGREELQAKADRETFEHWYIQDGMILYDGERGIGNIETRKEYGNFELILDWKIGPRGDSGIYLRNLPQVQIWDPGHQGVGSGGLYNNDPRNEPLKTVDKPVGEWNTMHIRMMGDTVWVTLNDELIVDGVGMDNIWGDSIPDKGPVVLQSHNTPLWFRNVYIKELN